MVRIHVKILGYLSSRHHCRTPTKNRPPSRWIRGLSTPSSATVENSDNHAEIAQLAEHLICNQGVVGSIPTFSITHERVKNEKRGVNK